MSTQNLPEGGGGFLPLTLPISPAPTVSAFDTTLPSPRSHPLKPGSAKETAFIQYVDKGILEVTRKYAKKFSEELDGGDERGYTTAVPSAAILAGRASRGFESIGEVCRDLGKLVDVIWVSGTPSLQIQYLLSIALLLTSYLPSFPASPRPTFRFLRKLDTAFASLLRGHNVNTGETLGGFATNAGKASVTDMVRLKSVVERARLVVLEVMGRGELSEHEMDDDDSDAQGDENGMEGQEDEDGRWEMEVARVYDQTIVALGELLRNSDKDGF